MPVLVDDIDDDTLFPALNLVLFGYGCICLVPSWRYTQPLVQGLVFCYCLLYALLVAHRLAAGALPAGAGIDSLEAVVALFSDRNAVFAGSRPICTQSPMCTAQLCKHSFFDTRLCRHALYSTCAVQHLRCTAIWGNEALTSL